MLAARLLRLPDRRNRRLSRPCGGDQAHLLPPLRPRHGAQGGQLRAPQPCWKHRPAPPWLAALGTTAPSPQASTKRSRLPEIATRDQRADASRRTGRIPKTSFGRHKNSCFAALTRTPAVPVAKAITHARIFQSTTLEIECFIRNGAVAVGTAIARRPPHRSRRAELPHRAPASGHDAEPPVGTGMPEFRAGNQRAASRIILWQVSRCRWLRRRRPCCRADRRPMRLRVSDLPMKPLLISIGCDGQGCG